VSTRTPARPWRKRALLALILAAALTTGLAVIRRGSPADDGTGDAQAGIGPRKATFTLECSAPAHPISPLIYGIGGSDNPWATGTTARRHGGNPTTRYNWELDTYNTASDWFFKNAGGDKPGFGYYDSFLTENRRRDVKSALTVPTIGWVAKDGSSYSFPVSVFGPQKATAPDQPDAGNGVAPDGKLIPPGPPTLTSVPAPPEHLERWVRQIREMDRTRGRSVDSYILDNEPMLWHITHRDVHPEPVSYDELLERTIAYGSAIRRADPDARIAGPAEWGWLAYHHSAKDAMTGVMLRPDRRMHGDKPLIPWYLGKLREYQQRTGVTLLDILDVHFYPQGDGVRLEDATGGRTDPATNARRIRSTRSLWDPTYRDESWIGENMRVIPLLKQWIAENYPGRKISIGEWDFGADSHISGGLAKAEALGRFGVEGIDSAYHWGSPAERSPGFWAFRAFRNFDGKGGRFQDFSMPVKGTATLASVFASRDAQQRQIVLIVLNLAPLSTLTAQIDLVGCGVPAQKRGFTYPGGEAGFTPTSVNATQTSVTVQVAASTINVIDLGLSPPQP
jgi:hypothetical protein